MNTQLLFELLTPSFAHVITSLRPSTKDSHNLFAEYKRCFPLDYTTGLSAFNGNYTLYHGYLSRMLLQQKFGSINHIGFVNSPNCFGKTTRNSMWKL